MSAPVVRPTPAELHAAVRRTVPDVIAPGLRVLFCGINPGLYSAATGHHFARPGNRFWKALHLSGFTEALLSPSEDATLTVRRLGITNLCARTTARAEDLRASELLAGARTLARKVARYRPEAVAFLGIGAFRLAFARPHALPGPQADDLAGAAVWVLPNPSGLNAHYGLPELVRRFGQLRACRNPNQAPPARPVPASRGQRRVPR
jgi:TDG/mug DNA glycosylase family protein